MSDVRNDLDAIKKKLLERRAELEEQLAELASEHYSDDQTQEPGDQASSATMENLRTSMSDAEVGELQRITVALEKIEAGTYGICSDCGDHISEKRLKLFPNASRCLICQEAYEDKGKF